MFKRFTNVDQLTDLIPLLQKAFVKVDFQWTIDKEMLHQVKQLVAQFVDGFDYVYKPFICEYDLCLIDSGSGSDTRVMAK